MLGLGLASSYVPSMFREARDWPKIRDWLVGDAPQPDVIAEEASDVLVKQVKRIKRGFAEQRKRLKEFRPGAVVILASDTGRLFTGVQVPQFCTYLGDKVWGSARLAELGEPAKDDIVRLKCAPDLAAHIHEELVHRGFDFNYSKTLKPLGQPDYGTTPALVEPARALLSRSSTPVIPIYVNCHVPPAPSGHRCYAVGQALADILSERPERLALVASGGLSHDHHNSRAGWIDRPLDEWVLNKLGRSKVQDLKPMFDLESDALRGGSAQVRLWIIVAAAFESLGVAATVFDYFPSYSAATGIGFAGWIPERQRRRAPRKAKR